jgi:glutathione S-transferase
MGDIQLAPCSDAITWRKFILCAQSLHRSQPQPKHPAMTPILHHYPASPFAEKIRLILGFKGIAYQSVMIPMIMPKPDVVALTGGYRRTPLLQIGSDVFCDTALIADVLEELQPAPSLYPVAHAGAARMAAQWCDSVLFGVGVAIAMQPEGAKSMFKDATPEMMAAFAADRKAFRANATVPRMTLDAALANLYRYMGALDTQLASGGHYVVGNTPTIADFSAYHCLWFVARATGVANTLAPFPQVKAWMARMAGFGHGKAEKLDSAEAVAIAARGEHSSALLGDSRHALQAKADGFALGDSVTVSPTDYGIDPVAGAVIGVSDTRISIARKDNRAGKVHVHFPRVGYGVAKQAA